MNLYDRSVDLQLKIEAAQSADVSVDLLSRASHLVADLDSVSTYVAAAERFRAAIGAASSLPINAKAVSQAVGAFRGGLSRHGANALQHQPAATLVQVAKEQERRVADWVKTCWIGQFSEYDPLIDRAMPGQLIGSSSRSATAMARASTLRAVRGLDPITGAADMTVKLGGGRDVKVWLDSVRAIAAELSAALQALDNEHAELIPQVQQALSTAGGDAGLALSDVTAELLAALKAAGVDEHLVVRRR